MIKIFSKLSFRRNKFLTPAEFLSLLKTDRRAIKKSKFIAPRPGTFGMGKVYVEFKYEPGLGANKKMTMATSLN